MQPQLLSLEGILQPRFVQDSILSLDAKKDIELCKLIRIVLGIFCQATVNGRLAYLASLIPSLRIMPAGSSHARLQTLEIHKPLCCPTKSHKVPPGHLLISVQRSERASSQFPLSPYSERMPGGDKVVIDAEILKLS